MDRQASDRQAADRQAADRQAADRQAADRQAADRQAADRQAADRQAADRQAADHETSENVKQVAEDVKGVKDTVTEFISYIKATEEDRIATLKHEVEMNKHEAQRAKEAEQKAQESASDAAAQLAHKVREFSEVELQLRRTEQQLEQETAAHGRMRQTAEQAQRSLREKELQVEEAQRTVHEKELHLQDAQRTAQSHAEQLQEQLTEALHKIHQVEGQLKDKEREAQKWEELFRESNVARAGESDKERLISRLEAEAREKDATIAEFDKTLKMATEECSAYKACHSSLELQIDRKSSEIVELRKQADHLRERLGAEVTAAHSGQLPARTEPQSGSVSPCTDAPTGLEVERRAAQEQELHSEREVEAALAERLCALERREAELAAREELLQRAEHRAQQDAANFPLAGRDFPAVAAALPLQRGAGEERGDSERSSECAEAVGEVATAEREAAAEREAVAECGLQRERERSHELELQLAELRERQRRATESEKENRGLKLTVQEQKHMLFSLQSQLYREQTIANFITPGELLKMARKEAGETLVHDNAELLLKNHHLETEVRHVRWHNDVMRKNLPRSAWEGVAKELAQPLPVPEDAAESGR